MIHVPKSLAPISFRDWLNLANEDWTPTYSGLQNPQKKELHESILRDQGWVCCYCGGRVVLQDSHIEHFRPQEQFQSLALDFNNLLVSCLRELAPGSPIHCGHAKGSAFDEARQMSPLDPDCESRFRHQYDGVISAPGDSANYMIELLQLNETSLRKRRKASLEGIFDAEFLDTATDAELRSMAEVNRRQDADGRLPAYGHVLALFAESLMTQIDLKTTSP